jgi:hypothetical protein
MLESNMYEAFLESSQVFGQGNTGMRFVDAGNSDQGA